MSFNREASRQDRDRRAHEVQMEVSGLDQYEKLNTEVANQLIEAGRGHDVARNLEKFEGLDHADIANRLLESGQGMALVFNLTKFEGLDHIDIASRLFDKGEAESIAINIRKFNDLSVEFLNKLVDAGHGAEIAKNLYGLKEVDHIDLANRLLDTEQIDAFIKEFRNFKGMDAGIALRLMEAGKASFVAKELRHFKDLNNEVANKFIDEDLTEVIEDYPESFEGIKQETVYRIIERGITIVLLDSIQKIPGLDHSAIVNKIIDEGEQLSMEEVEEFFTNVNQATLDRLEERNRSLM